MRRVYTSVAHLHAPFKTSNISFAGLGNAAWTASEWPAGRTYYSTHFYRAPYQAGYYQSGALRGFGDDAPAPVVATMAPTKQALALAGAAVGFGMAAILGSGRFQGAAIGAVAAPLAVYLVR